MSTINSRAMFMAHHVQRSQPAASWAFCVQYAWNMLDIRELLSHGIVKFVYTKKNGEIRQAKGTLWMELIPEDKRPLKARGREDERRGEREPNYGVINYFDLDKQDWRSFDICAFCSVQDAWQLVEVKEKRTKRENHAGRVIIPKK